MKTKKSDALIEEQYDAIIIGAGISGISAAYHFQTQFPDKTYKIIERRAQLGGTWDLFNYPGTRSDSDMYTFGFSFYPWKGKSSIAKKSDILNYLHDTARTFNIDQHICFGRHIKQANWCSKQAQWHLNASITNTNKTIRYRCHYLFMCVGYYNYDQGYVPQFTNMEQFKGALIHPQHWPKETDYHDKKVVIIGSGATAITLLPAMAKATQQITLLQRSPSYISLQATNSSLTTGLSDCLGHWAVRWWFIMQTLFFYYACRCFPNYAKKQMINQVRKELGDTFDAQHFTPNYRPWDQRICLCPDGDFFNALKKDNADIVTDHIDRFTTNGIALQSGKHLNADIIIMATGLELLFLGGIKITLDGHTMRAADHHVYKGFMCSNTPNLFISVGYTNASWTLKVDLSNQYACRLIKYMDKHQYRFCQPQLSADIEDTPLLDLSSGYVQRGLPKLPKQGHKTPWKFYQNYLLDTLSLRYSPVTDKAMHFYRSQR